jgi:hypothetical protein
VRDIRVKGEMHTEIWWGNIKERRHVVDLGIDRRIILKYILNKWDGCMEWSYLAQERDRWRAVLSTVMNL